MQGDQGLESQTNTQGLKITKENVLPLLLDHSANG